MLCCTSVLSSVLRSMAQGLGELLYAVLQICALVPNWALRFLLLLQTSTQADLMMT